jgi:1-deoxy-D-xylulose-5-phosphate synthase
VIEHLSESQIRTPVVRIGWPDQFVEHGSINILREKHGLTAAAALEKIRPFLKKKLETKQPRPAA